MRVEIWSDVICPWCYIGRRRFERALDRFAGRDGVEVALRSYELDPNAAPDTEVTAVEFVAEKYGMTVDQVQRQHARISDLAAAEGLEYHLERTRPTNTLDAHRLLQLASVRHVRPAVEERFERGYFTEGADLGNSATLLRLATEGGLGEVDARRVLVGQAFTLQVRMDEKDAASLGATGVPFFVFDRARAISGAQPIEVFERALASNSPTGSRHLLPSRRDSSG
jgi:predicted DsbA family dithiol-disulfide isomerase